MARSRISPASTIRTRSLKSSRDYCRNSSASTRPVPNRQGLPLDAGVREELAKRVFALVAAGSGCRCFDLVIDFATRTADVVELELQRDCGFLVGNQDRPQVASQSLTPAHASQGLLSGSRDDGGDYRR